MSHSWVFTYLQRRPTIFFLLTLNLMTSSSIVCLYAKGKLAKRHVFIYKQKFTSKLQLVSTFLRSTQTLVGNLFLSPENLMSKLDDAKSVRPGERRNRDRMEDSHLNNGNGSARERLHLRLRPAPGLPDFSWSKTEKCTKWPQTGPKGCKIY
jgi:hypothetical protein